MRDRRIAIIRLDRSDADCKRANIIEITATIILMVEIKRSIRNKNKENVETL
jgi:predicted KAP-like P-loop ATPase